MIRGWGVRGNGKGTGNAKPQRTENTQSEAKASQERARSKAKRVKSEPNASQERAKSEPTASQTRDKFGSRENQGQDRGGGGGGAAAGLLSPEHSKLHLRTAVKIPPVGATDTFTPQPPIDFVHGGRASLHVTDLYSLHEHQTRF